jgi:RNA polymerase sigma-70 factor (ECF subfamily)
MKSNSTTPHSSDKYLIEMGLQGDQEALHVLFTRYRRLLYALAHRLLRNHEEAEDAVQSSSLMAYRNLCHLQDRSYFRSWLVRIVINEALDIIRKKKSRSTIAAERPYSDESGEWLERFPAPGPDPEQALATRESAGVLMAHLVRLPNSLRSAVMLCDIGEQTIQEAAAILGLAPNTVKTRLRRGRAKLELAMRGGRSLVNKPDVLIGV